MSTADHTATFYEALPVRRRFIDVANPSAYEDVPLDWHVVVTDLVGSTEAIAGGRYKEVNMAGAAGIAALLNEAGETRLPFCFGGDGALVLIPDFLVERARGTLSGVCRAVEEAFDLTLRAGIVPMADIAAAGHTFRVARIGVSPHYDQAMFAGSGIRYAEDRIKESRDQYGMAHPAEVPPDFSGLECRWHDIKGPHEEVVTLIVQAAPDRADAFSACAEVLHIIEDIYGSERTYRPVERSGMRETYSVRRLSREAGLRTGRGRLEQGLYTLRILVQNLLLRLFVAFDVTTGETHWPGYVDRLVESIDYRKYDDALRMVVSGTARQREALTARLEAGYQQGDFAYGISVSDRSHVTCLVFERMGRQVHFLDGAGGGYTRAARALKDRLALLEES